MISRDRAGRLEGYLSDALGEGVELLRADRMSMGQSRAMYVAEIEGETSGRRKIVLRVEQWIMRSGPPRVQACFQLSKRLGMFWARRQSSKLIGIALQIVQFKGGPVQVGINRPTAKTLRLITEDGLPSGGFPEVRSRGIFQWSGDIPDQPQHGHDQGD